MLNYRDNESEFTDEYTSDHDWSESPKGSPLEQAKSLDFLMESVSSPSVQSNGSEQPTIQDTMANKVFKAQFGAYLHNVFQGENLEFLEDVVQYQAKFPNCPGFNEGGQTAAQSAERIYHNYFQGSRALQLTPQCVSAIRDSLVAAGVIQSPQGSSHTSSGDSTPLSHTLFDAATVEVEALLVSQHGWQMARHHQGFLESNEYKQLKLASKKSLAPAVGPLLGSNLGLSSADKRKRPDDQETVSKTFRKRSKLPETTQAEPRTIKIFQRRQNSSLFPAAASAKWSPSTSFRSISLKSLAASPARPFCLGNTDQSVRAAAFAAGLVDRKSKSRSSSRSKSSSQSKSRSPLRTPPSMPLDVCSTVDLTRNLHVKAETQPVPSSLAQSRGLGPSKGLNLIPRVPKRILMKPGGDKMGVADKPTSGFPSTSPPSRHYRIIQNEAHQKDPATNKDVLDSFSVSRNSKAPSHIVINPS